MPFDYFNLMSYITSVKLTHSQVIDVSLITFKWVEELQLNELLFEYMLKKYWSSGEYPLRSLHRFQSNL